MDSALNFGEAFKAHTAAHLCEPKTKTKNKNIEKKCVLCSTALNDYNMHNADPLANGFCCAKCNLIVVEARILKATGRGVDNSVNVSLEEHGCFFSNMHFPSVYEKAKENGVDPHVFAFDVATFSCRVLKKYFLNVGVNQATYTKQDEKPRRPPLSPLLHSFADKTPKCVPIGNNSLKVLKKKVSCKKLAGMLQTNEAVSIKAVN